MIYSILGTIAGIVPMIICYTSSPKRIGAGDVKLIAVVGLYVGIASIFETIFYSCLYVIAYLIGIRCIKWKRMQNELPFAPFVLLGTITALLSVPR